MQQAHVNLYASLCNALYLMIYHIHSIESIHI